MRTSALDKVAYVLLVVGGLNWGLVGAFDFNLVDELFGVESAVSRVVYVLVGLAALVGLLSLVTKLSAKNDSAS